MSLIGNMSSLTINEPKQTMSKVEIVDKTNLSPKAILYSWESWEKLKLSTFHGKMLTTTRHLARGPNGEKSKFFLHQLDDFDYNPDVKLFIVMRTLKRLFGNVTNFDSNKGRRLNAKLSFIRERGKQHFLDRKPITELIEFPEAYWEKYKTISRAREKKIKEAKTRGDTVEMAKDCKPHLTRLRNRNRG